MTSTPPQIALAPGPRSVQDARRWVVRRCRDLGRPELAECAEVGVSELVSNALLHGSTPIQVGMAGTTAHPRVEVRDASTDAPRIGGAEVTLLGSLDDDALLTFGRGLGIVARVSRAWGADIDDDGKVVWFEPAEDVEDVATEGVVTGLAGQAERRRALDRAGVRTFVLHGVPLRLHVAFVRHYRELRREVRLLALAHATTYPLARDLSELFTALDAPAYDGLLLAVADIADAADAAVHDHTGADTAVDLRVDLTREGAAELGRLAELLEAADVFCREERLLSLARDREQRRFQRWFLEELEAQGAGAAARRWDEAPGAGDAAGDDAGDEPSRSTAP
ncbi:ATP-binding protein [Nocardioides sp. AX2bis]|uniref:ATP-binding protein n=1 Tax=Nocardioides sp. AX2bis TaxID=2653157 RepID=UPI0012F1B108|nr:ATP-binding protein [Nocardioides sp. AX2bis]VXC45077.1 ATPase [Nocardioides sp. AX2bis]